MTWRRASTWTVTALLISVAALVLPRSQLTGSETLATGLFVTALVAALWSGPQTLLLGLAALCLTATAVGADPIATLRERDLAVGLMPAVLPLAAAALSRSRPALGLTLLGGLLAGPVRMLVYDPFLDPSCDGCAPGELVVWPAPDLADVLHTAGVALALLGVALATRRRPFELYGVLGCLAAYAADWHRDDALFLGCLVATAAVTRQAVEAARRRSQLERLVQALESEGGPPDPSRLRDLHSMDDPVSALVLESWRLTAELAQRVEELSSARAGVVRVAAAERRALERDLHDGVQQQLLSLGLDLKLGAASAPPASRGVLTRALAEVTTALDEVRELTHGVYPPLLSARGLSSAVAYSTRRHGSAATLEVLDARLDPDVERAAFAFLDDAIRRGATSVSALQDGGLHLRADGVDPPSVRIEDLVGAVGGSLAPVDGGVVAMIPCAS